MAQPGPSGESEPLSLAVAGVADPAAHLEFSPQPVNLPVDPLSPSSDLDGAAVPDLFGTALEPALREACDGRLSAIQWFRTDWQRGGALTGYAQFTDEAGRGQAAVVKLPVPPQELLWLERLQPGYHGLSSVVPRVWAGGRSVGGYDLAWVVMERLSHGPLDGRWGGLEFDLLLEAAGRFYAACGVWPADEAPRCEDWPAVLERSRRAVREVGLESPQRWNKALKTVQKKLSKMLGVWGDHQGRHWCHGDLHLGNAMTAAAPPGGPAVLFDLAKIHAGHWVEDAVYLEHLYWAKPERLGGRNVVKQLVEQRRRWGLKTPEWCELANIRRVLLAAAAPGQAAKQNQPAVLRASLGRLEQLLPGWG